MYKATLMNVTKASFQAMENNRFITRLKVDDGCLEAAFLELDFFLLGDFFDAMYVQMLARVKLLRSLAYS